MTHLVQSLQIRKESVYHRLEYLLCLLPAVPSRSVVHIEFMGICHGIVHDLSEAPSFNL